MLLRRTEKLPDGDAWCYELKFDGYRALAIKTARRVHLRSRNDNDFTARYPQIVTALSPMPAETVIDGAVVALDPDGNPPFTLLRRLATAGGQPHYFYSPPLVPKSTSG